MVREVKCQKEISDSDHVTRYCSFQHCSNSGIQPTAFRPKDNEGSLSVFWVEYFDRPTRNEQMADVKEDAEKTLTISKNGKFAILNVKRIKQCIYEVSSKPAHVRHSPTDSLSHSEIHSDGFLNDSRKLLIEAKLVQEAKKEGVFPVSVPAR